MKIHIQSLGLLVGLVSLVAAQCTASSEWDAAYEKAETAVVNLTLEEKVDLATGKGFFSGPCIGNTYAIDSINFPGLCLQDSALGVRSTSGNSVFPAGINAAATFNRTLMYQRGAAMGEEFRGKGVHAQLGPFMNIMRAPAAGRAWEGSGGDPFLTGEASYQTILGIQSQGVQAVAKHFINNEQEHSRFTSSSDVDDRTTHEVYLHPFLRSVQANVAAAMCSYNLVNGTYACQNNATLQGLLKGELGFRGYVMSDWIATHSTDSANEGLDMTMPGDVFPGSIVSYFGDSLVNAVNDGSVPESRVDDMATRILAGWYLLGQDSGYPPVSLGDDSPNVQGNHSELIRLIDAASTVLLKNEKSVLPLTSPGSIAVIGNGAGNNSLGDNGCLDRNCDNGVLGQGWGSGTANYPYLVAPVDAITTRASQTGTNISSSLSDSDLDAAAKAAEGADVAFVFLTADSGELTYLVEGNQGDRNNLDAWHNGDDLVAKVASVCNNTIVVVNTVGPVVVENWIDHENVTGLVWSGLPGQEAGNGLVDILWGDYNPSARLPYTIGKSVDDYAAQVDYTFDLGTLQINYTEGIFVDYRHFDAADVEPRYEYGFGLSYTTFDYSGLVVAGSVTAGSNYNATGVGRSLDAPLHEQAIFVNCTITNNGTVAGTEVPQLYLSPPAYVNSAPYLLKGFDAVYLEPGQSATVSFPLSAYDLSYWNVVTQKWEVPSGATGMTVGASSRDHRLTGSIEVQ